MDVINKEKDATMEKWVGRTRQDSTELTKKPITSHVARMTGGMLEDLLLCVFVCLFFELFIHLFKEGQKGKNALTREFHFCIL